MGSTADAGGDMPVPDIILNKGSAKRSFPFQGDETLEFIPLGAGNEVGRSCCLLKVRVGLNACTNTFSVPGISVCTISFVPIAVTNSPVVGTRSQAQHLTLLLICCMLLSVQGKDHHV